MSSSSSSSSLAALKALLGRGEKETALAGCACVLSRGNVDGSVFLHHLLQMYLKGEEDHHNAPFVFLAPFGNRETQVASNFAFSLSPFPPLLPPPLLHLSPSLLSLLLLLFPPPSFLSPSPTLTFWLVGAGGGCAVVISFSQAFHHYQLIGKKMVRPTAFALVFLPFSSLPCVLLIFVCSCFLLAANLGVKGLHA